MAGRKKTANNKAAAATTTTTTTAATATPTATFTVNKDILENLSKSLTTLLIKTNRLDQQVEVDPTDLTSVLNLVLKAVSVLTENVETGEQAREVTENDKAKESRDRIHVDELDECRQRAFKGNLIITSQAIPQKSRLLSRLISNFLRTNKALLSM